MLECAAVQQVLAGVLHGETLAGGQIGLRQRSIRLPARRRRAEPLPTSARAAAHMLPILVAPKATIACAPESATVNVAHFKPTELRVSSTPPTPGAETGIDVYEAVVDVLVEECEVKREAITPDSNLAEDFGLDSLAFIDFCYALDTKLHIKIPFESWVNDINSGLLDAKQAFLMKNVVAQVEELVRSRAA